MLILYTLLRLFYAWNDIQIHTDHHQTCQAAQGGNQFRPYTKAIHVILIAEVHLYSTNRSSTEISNTILYHIFKKLINKFLLLIPQKI